jgi:DNA-binding XRE family transcriptional regulator
MSTKQHIGKQIKAYRLANQMTQTQMAVWLGIGLGTVVSLEQGRRCKELTLAKIEAKLKGREVVAA